MNTKPALNTALNLLKKPGIAIALLLAVALTAHAGDVVIESGRLTVDGQFIRKIYWASANGPRDETDVGQIVSRVLSMTKQHDAATTAVRISYTDATRSYPNSKGCRWELRVDGASCPSQPLVYDVYSGSVSGGSANPHHSRTFVGYCEGLSAGAKEIQVWVGNTPGRSDSDCHTGWNESTWTLEAEEVLK